MKTIWQYFAIAALAVSAAACTPEYPTPSANGLPQASDLDVIISVDQATNYVTFVMNNKGVVPVWIFGDQNIDGKAGKNYAYTMNNLTLRFREEGEHTVEVKAYNANGLSQGSLVKTFTLENTYRDPFDPSPYIRAISGGSSQSWVWNSTEANHFGCGPVGDPGDPLAWWQCPAGGKEGFLYDDVMTFDSEGNYTFKPGDDQAYAKGDAEFPAGHAIEADDYLFPAEEKTTHYTFESEWNEAGIEEIYLVLDPGSILSYVAHKSIVDDPRYYVMETSTSSMKKKLQLMSTVYTPNNGDGISYYYEFVPEGSVIGEADPLYGYESKVWVLDNEAAGYMGCGPDVNSPTGWWSAKAHEKDDYGVKDDELTFFKDGKYIFNPGEDGKVYCNWESGYLPDGHSYSGDGSTDYDAPASVQESTYTLGSDADGDYIELPANIFFGYVANKAMLDTPTRLYIKELTPEKLVVAAKFDGISWQFIYKPKDGQDITPPGGDDYDGEYIYFTGENQFSDSVVNKFETWFTGADWSGGLDPQGTFADGKVTLTIPDGIGGEEWKGQVKLHTDIPINPKSQYRYSVKITSSAAGTVTLKNTAESDPGGNEFFYDGSVEINADENEFVFDDISMDSKENMLIIFDFGRMPVGTRITISDIEVVEKVAVEARLETWFTGADWSGGLDPQATLADGKVTFTVPDGIGGEEWKGQVKLHTNFDIDPKASYFYSVTIEADQASTITIKTTAESDPGDNEFFYDGAVEVPANEAFTYIREEMSMNSDETLLLIFDFGRTPVGTKVTIKDFVFIKL